MKKIRLILAFVCAASLFSCSDDETSVDVLENAGAPTEVSAFFLVPQDNSGDVTITPNATDAVSYDVYFGDARTYEPIRLNAGESATHTFLEGLYNVKVVAYSVNGKSTEITQLLTVSFLAPQNLGIIVTPSDVNAYTVGVEATADLETYFMADFGDGQPPVQFMEGASATHTYAAAGTYTITVTAYSAGSEVTQATEQVTIVAPPTNTFPLTFELDLDYGFINFGGAEGAKVANPDASGINTSANVGMVTKNGPEVWAGNAISLSEPGDFSVMQKIKVKVWSPQAGIPVLVKFENLNDAAINIERTATTTVANAWEELTYDFTGINNANNYQKVVIFFNFGTVGTGQVYYFDDITQSN